MIFITALDDKFLLECNSYDFQEILKKFDLYKLKSDVNFKVEENLVIFLTNYSDLNTK